MTGKGVCPAKRGRSCTGFDVTGKDMRYWINSLARVSPVQDWIQERRQ